MIKRQGWQEVKKWEEWLEENMTEERKTIYRQNIQKSVAVDALPVAHYLAVTSGSELDWASSGSPMPIDGKIPEMDKVIRIRCWYCGGDNHTHWEDCVYCGAPLKSEVSGDANQG
jgi:hypothetical protein